MIPLKLESLFTVFWENKKLIITSFLVLLTSILIGIFMLRNKSGLGDSSVHQHKKKQQNKEDTDVAMDIENLDSFAKRLSAFIKVLNPKDMNNSFVRETIISFFDNLFKDLKQLSVSDLNSLLMNSYCHSQDKEFIITQCFYDSKPCQNAMNASLNFKFLATLILKKNQIFQTKFENAAFYNSFRIYIESIIKTK